MSSIYDWTVTEAPNATIDDTINWAEFMPPSDVNNSARAMMARIRQLLNDIGGVVLSTDGAADNAIQVTSVSGIANSYPDGYIIVFRARKATTAEFTLNVNAIGDVPVYKNTTSGVIRAVGGDITTWGIYECIYNSNLMNAGAGWVLMNPSQQAIALPGQIGTFARKAAPGGWLVCAGATHLVSEYPELYQAIGRDWTNSSVGQDQFQVPDFRGKFLRGWNDGATENPDQNRVWASYQADQFKSHNHPNSRTQDAGSHNHDYDSPGSFQIGQIYGSGIERYSTPNIQKQTSTNGNHSHGLNITAEGGNETRPANYPVLYCIKT